MAIHPVQTYDQVKGAIVESYKRDMINGNAQSHYHWVTYALGTAATSVVGTKGAGTLTKGAATSAKAGAATVKSGAKQSVAHARNLDIARLLPYKISNINLPV